MASEREQGDVGKNGTGWDRPHGLLIGLLAHCATEKGVVVVVVVVGRGGLGRRADRKGDSGRSEKDGSSDND